jgi:CDP-diacylglycerol--serine O-phosphatidyltransferase
LAFAIVALMISGVCDLFDGFVARRLTRTDAQRKFGGSLDSVVDACSFGFAPVVLMYAAGLNGWLEIPLLILFSICVVWRLAYFDTVGLLESRKHNYFVGLPVTYVAMFLPLAFLSGFWSESALRACVGVTLVGLAVSMVSAIPVRKPSGVFYLLFPTAGVVLTVVFIVFAQSFVR